MKPLVRGEPAEGESWQEFPLPDETWEEYFEYSLLHEPLLVAVIPLTQGKVAYVDRADLPLVADYTWRAARDKHNWYALSHEKGNRKATVRMHRLILPAPGRLDHADGNGLNNRRANLRLATALQNGRNRGKHAGTTSPYKGVYRSGRDNKPWMAQITVHRKRVSLGRYLTPEEAARSYDEAAERLFGEFARTNQGLGLFTQVK